MVVWAGMAVSSFSGVGTAAAARYYNGPRQCVQQIVKQHGVAGLYRGMSAMAVRDMPGYGLYLVIFEFLDHLMHRHGWTDAQVNTLPRRL